MTYVQVQTIDGHKHTFDRVERVSEKRMSDYMAFLVIQTVASTANGERRDVYQFNLAHVVWWSK
jgi:hypothetical protein